MGMLSSLSSLQLSGEEPRRGAQLLRLQVVDHAADVLLQRDPLDRRLAEDSLRVRLQRRGSRCRPAARTGRPVPSTMISGLSARAASSRLCTCSAACSSDASTPSGTGHAADGEPATRDEHVGAGGGERAGVLADVCVCDGEEVELASQGRSARTRARGLRRCPSAPRPSPGRFPVVGKLLMPSKPRARNCSRGCAAAACGSRRWPRRRR